MTRETKLGLAVALAFLALVGGVLGVKLLQGDGPSGTDGPQTVANSTPDAKSEPKTTVASAQPAPPPPATVAQPTNPVVPTGATTTSAADTPKPASAHKPDADTVSATFTNTGTAPAAPAALSPPMTPPVAPPEASPVTPATTPAPETATTPEAPKPADAFAVPPPPPGRKPGPVPPLDTPKSAPPEIRNEKSKPAPIVVPSGGSVDDAGSSASSSASPPLNATPPTITAPVTGLNETNSANLAPATSTRSDSPAGNLSDAGSIAQPPPTISRPTTSVSETTDTTAGSMTPAIATPAAPSPAPVGTSAPNSVTFEKAPGSTGMVTSPSAPTEPAFTAPRSPETLAPEVRSAPSVRVESGDPWRGGGSGNVAAVGLAPPMGASGVVVQPPAAGPPPLVKPVAPGGPKAQSYLVEEYRLQAGDSFEKLSQKFYFSPKYAGALQQYNQNEPLAAPGLRANPPMLSVGQVVWMPPARILERDYGQLIPGLQPLPADRSAPGVPTAIRPVAPTGPQLYKVRSRGESLWEIARHTLNDSNQWAQILNLNRTLKPQPEIPLAPGTILRLPPEAKIDAADRP
jgi:hypothetical protein